MTTSGGIRWGMGEVIRDAEGGGSSIYTNATNIVGEQQPLSEWKRVDAPTAPTCPRDSTPLTWYDGWGYRCDDCYTFVCIPRQTTPADA